MRKVHANETLAAFLVYFAVKIGSVVKLCGGGCYQIKRMEKWRRERDSNPRYCLGTHAFQACALNHSAISPPIRIHFRSDFSRLQYFSESNLQSAHKGRVFVSRLIIT